MGTPHLEPVKYVTPRNSTNLTGHSFLTSSVNDINSLDPDPVFLFHEPNLGLGQEGKPNFLSESSSKKDHFPWY